MIKLNHRSELKAEEASISERMANLDRLLTLVHLLADTSDGLTLDEMARELGISRRTAERMRAIVAHHFDLDESADDRKMRFRIRGSLRRVFTRPDAAEVAALQVEVNARRREKAPQSHLLESLLAKVKGALDDREKLRLEPDLEPLVRLQRTRVQPGPVVKVEPESLALIQGAMMAGVCIEFDYLPDGADKPTMRQLVPYGLIHGPITYLVGNTPGREDDPMMFRLDRMSQTQMLDLSGIPPGQWDLDAWMAKSFGIWREDDREIVLRIAPNAVDRARKWRFHTAQIIEEDGDDLVVRFRAGGLQEIADHIFTWAGDVLIEGPDELRDVMRERLKIMANSLRPDLTE